VITIIEIKILPRDTPQSLSPEMCAGVNRPERASARFDAVERSFLIAASHHDDRIRFQG